MKEVELKRIAAFDELVHAARDLVYYVGAPVAPDEDPLWALKSTVVAELGRAVRDAAHRFVAADTAAIIAQSTFVGPPERTQ